jgi:membrane associated rhomboid family serine protease
MELLLQSPITLALLATNIVLSTMALGNTAIMDKLLFHVARVRNNREWYRVITSAFIHGGPIHLFLNMYALYIFGPSFEHGLGPLPFIVIYFGSLLGSSGLEWIEHFRDPNYRSLGASGALSGLTLAFVMFAPMVQFSLMFMFPMPAFVFAICYIAISAWASTSGSLPGIAHAGHLGGALAGVAIICIWYPDVPQAMIDEIVANTRGF